MATPDFAHTSVLLTEVVDLLAPVGPGTVVDATLGGAGHAAALLDARSDVSVLGLDRDLDALDAARRRLQRHGSRARTVHARFDQLADVVRREVPAEEPVVGVLFDLGVSSPQFDRADRGFSYRHDGPLDMRMDREGGGPTAADLLNTLPHGELARILRTYGEERFAGRIAGRILDARPLDSTLQLAEIVREAIPAATRRTGGHPAKRTFQALRIAVNDELEVLKRGLDAALEVVAPGGRVLVISFHSGEDRIVKQRFRLAETGGCTCPPRLPCVCGARTDFELLTRGGITASRDELDTNPRSASARLRAVERLRPPTPNEVPS